MKKIYSKINNELLHIVYNTNDKIDERIDLIDKSNFIQCSVVHNNKIGFKYRPHYHNLNELPSNKIQTQETWFVIKGSIKVFHYDLNNELLNTEILKKGFLNITLKGAHTLEIMENDTIIMEHKNGPYFGFEKDKTII